jgi:hypothetical protein
MTAIMCTRPLQQALVQAGEQWPERRRRPTAEPEGRLGNWAATVVLDLTPPLVVAVEERSSLTLLVRLRPVRSFRRRLANAVRRALTARGLTDLAADAQAMLVEDASFTMFRNNPDLRSALEFAAFETACHVGEQQDAESVQEMLEGSPHTVTPLAPTDVIRRLFDVPVEQGPSR